jgi:hypothetical protein
VMLASHSCITSFPESHFFLSLLKRRGRWRRVVGLGSRRTRLVLEQFGEDIGTVLPGAGFSFFPSVRGVTRRFVRHLDALAADRGKSIWIEKTPDHVFFVEDIKRLVPDSMFIHIVRDGREVVASLYEVSRRHVNGWGGPWSIDKCIEHWKAAVARSLRYSESALNHVLVRYEDLRETPSSELERLAGFLGISLEEEMLTRPRARSSGIVRVAETWKADIYDSPSRKPLVKFDQYFNDAQREYVTMRVEELNLTLSGLRISTARKKARTPRCF